MTDSLSNAKFTQEGSTAVLNTLKSIEGHMKKVADASDKVKQKTKEGTDETKKLGAGFQQIKLQALISNLRTMVGLLKSSSKHLVDGAFAFDMNQRAAHLTKSTLIDFKAVSDSLKGTVPLTDLQQMVNMANNLKLNMQSMPQIATLAANVAAQQGKKTGDVMQALIRSFATLRVTQLQGLGISIDITTAMRRHEKALDVAKGSLTQVQKQQALLNEVMRANPDLVKNMGTTMTQQLQQVNTMWANFVSDLQEGVAKHIMPTMTTLLNHWNDHKRVIKSGPLVALKDLTVGSEKYGKTLERLIDNEKAYVKGLKLQLEATKGNIFRQHALEATHQKTIESLKKLIRLQTRHTKALEKSTGAWYDNILAQQGHGKKGVSKTSAKSKAGKKKKGGRALSFTGSTQGGALFQQSGPKVGLPLDQIGGVGGVEPPGPDATGIKDQTTQADIFADKYTQNLTGLIDMNFVASDSFSQLALGISGTMDAMQQGAPSAIAASKKMAGAFIKDKKKLAIISMVMELAAAAASFAVSDFRGGALHLQSAGLYGAAAAFQFASSAAGGGGGNSRSSLPARNRASRGTSNDAPVIQMTNNFNVPIVGDSEFGRFVITSANKAARSTGDQFDSRLIGDNLLTGT